MRGPDARLERFTMRIYHAALEKRHREDTQTMPARLIGEFPFDDETTGKTLTDRMTSFCPSLVNVTVVRKLSGNKDPMFTVTIIELPASSPL